MRFLMPDYNALSFLSEGGFRYFLPAYLIADLEDRLQTADPVFHLTNGFSDKIVKIPVGQRIYEKTIGKSAFVNPRRYGAMTWHDHARCRLSVFTREEAGAIVAYLEYKWDAEPPWIQCRGHQCRTRQLLAGPSCERSYASDDPAAPHRRSGIPERYWNWN